MCQCVPDRVGIWKCWFLRRGENWSTRRKTSWSKGENQQQTQPTYGVDAVSWTRATLELSERSHHCATLRKYNCSKIPTGTWLPPQHEKRELLKFRLGKSESPTRPPNKTSLTIFLFLITFSQFLPLVIEVLRILPLMLCLILYWQTGRRRYLVIGILTFFGLLILLTLTALIPTGSKNPGRVERIAR